MAITDLFDTANADMSGLLSNGRFASVSDVIQTVSIEVDENCPEELREAGNMKRKIFSRKKLMHIHLEFQAILQII